MQKCKHVVAHAKQAVTSTITCWHKIGHIEHKNHSSCALLYSTHEHTYSMQKLIMKSFFEYFFHLDRQNLLIEDIMLVPHWFPV